MRRDREVLVVGAGVTGLTTAVRLTEAGHRVRVVAAGTGAATTSYAAGATWSPHLVEWTGRTRRWAYATLDELRALAADPAAAIRFVPGTEAVPAGEDRPDWHERFGFAPVAPPPGFAAAWHYVRPVVAMPDYLGYLQRRAGVPVEQRTVDRLDLAPVVVNCTGSGARDLVPGDPVTPVEGHVVIVDNPGVTEWFVGGSEPPVYFFPHGDTVLLGGTAGHTRTAGEIRDRCAAIEPRLAGARIRHSRVGQRPVRPVVRLEREQVGDSLVVHNYGHGGAGITLSWGCADEVVRLLAAA